jgi:hypothetical protein
MVWGVRRRVESGVSLRGGGMVGFEVEPRLYYSN